MAALGMWSRGTLTDRFINLIFGEVIVIFLRGSPPPDESNRRHRDSDLSSNPDPLYAGLTAQTTSSCFSPTTNAFQIEAFMGVVAFMRSRAREKKGTSR